MVPELARNRSEQTRSDEQLTADLTRQAWAALDGEPRLLDGVELTGDGTGLLASPLAAMPAALAAVSVSTVAAAVLDAACARRDPSPVSIDRRHVALAARSERYARVDGAGPGAVTGGFAPLSRFWRTRDGWIRLHANYAWHRERALEVLGVPDDPRRVQDAAATWAGQDLEDALAAAGALGSLVRTPEQWGAHPQGQAVAALPVLRARPGAGPGRPVGAGRAAAGVRVLDLTRVIAGPVATRTLAAWGADVLRLDSPDLPEIPAQALDTLPGKRSAELDLRSPDGRRRLEDLLVQADVLVQGYRPGALARVGLDEDDLAERHPHLSVVTLSAWGATGPWAQRRGFDSLVQCSTGIASLTGDDAGPGTLPAQVLDHATGYLAAAAALLSLASVAGDGPPRRTHLSLAQTAHWLLGAGVRELASPRDVDPGAYLVTLGGSGAPVHVIGPPGRAGDLRPRWTATTRLGADPASFEGR